MEQVFTVTRKKSMLEQKLSEGLQPMEEPCWNRGQV